MPATPRLAYSGTNFLTQNLKDGKGDGGEAFAAVLPGTYTVRAVLQAFKTFQRRGLTIGTQQFITVDLVMEVGTLEESISVTAAAPLIVISNASTGEVLEKKTLDALPALNRN